MKVSKLINQLSKMPQDASVRIIYDGAARMDVEIAWLSRSGAVMLTAMDEDTYATEDRPLNAPTQEDASYWCADDGYVFQGENKKFNQEERGV